jgi:hypothetical protein
MEWNKLGLGYLSTTTVHVCIFSPFNLYEICNPFSAFFSGWICPFLRWGLSPVPFFFFVLRCFAIHWMGGARRDVIFFFSVAFRALYDG